MYKTLYDRKIFDTNHSLDRLNKGDRFQDYTGNKPLKDVFLDAIDKAVKVIMNKHNDLATSYGVHQISTRAGLVIDWRKDLYSKDRRNHAFIQTYLPFKDYHYFDKDDIVIIVESLLTDWDLERSREQNKIIRVSESSVTSLRENNFSVTMFEGKFWDWSGMEEFILLD
jgi:hypothetical protein